MNTYKYDEEKLSEPENGFLGSISHCYAKSIPGTICFNEFFHKERFLSLLYCANSINPISKSDYPKHTLSDIIKIPRKATYVKIYAFAVMDNHFHILLEDAVLGGRGKFMQKLMIAYSMYYNTFSERQGPVFLGGYKSTEVTTPSQLAYSFLYVNLNPLDMIKKEATLAEKKAFLESNRFGSLYAYEHKDSDVYSLLDPCYNEFLVGTHLEHGISQEGIEEFELFRKRKQERNNNSLRA